MLRRKNNNTKQTKTVNRRELILHAEYQRYVPNDGTSLIRVEDGVLLIGVLCCERNDDGEEASNKKKKYSISLISFVNFTCCFYAVKARLFHFMKACSDHVRASQHSTHKHNASSDECTTAYASFVRRT